MLEGRTVEGAAVGVFVGAVVGIAVGGDAEGDVGCPLYDVYIEPKEIAARKVPSDDNTTLFQGTEGAEIDSQEVP